MEKQQSKKPLIRFPEFKDAWEHKRLNELLSEAKKRNEDLKYGKDEVLSVSGELGIVNQIEHLGRSYAGVSVHNYHVVEVGDIVYTKSPLKANPFGIIKLNKGKPGIVSTLYAVYKVNQQTAYGPFIDYYFSLDANTNRYLRPLVKKGAKNDMKINNAYVLHDRIFAPAIPEQKRIASFFTVLDKKIAELKQKKNLLEQYKKGVMQKLFSQELRFKDENGKDFPKWEKKKLKYFLKERKTRNTNCEFEEVFSVAKNKGVINQIEHLGRSFASLEISNYKVVLPNDIIYTKSPTSEFPFGIIKQNKLNRTGVVSVLYGVFIPTNKSIGLLLDLYFSNWENTLNYLTPIVQKGAKNTINIGNTDFLNGSEISLPASLEEQIKIADYILAIDSKINYCNIQLENTKQYRKGLLQKMFI
ncbi:MAG: restriction endonuclease subunit S [Pedobacter sp.]|jgi:type I restriction enzyme S subunit|uniref:restriction endonuclease subunit S n=1 Tax=Pedobacter sp. TaxID=1411316 RepID=UPI003568F082